MTEAVNANGCDRHLMGTTLAVALRVLLNVGCRVGLRLLQNAGENHAFFKDPLFARSSRWNLSTSQLSSEYFEGYGWGEVRYSSQFIARC